MRYPVLVFAAAVLLSVSPAGVFAQEDPPMVDQRRDAEKETYFALFNDLKQFPSSDSQRKAYEAAIEYLKRFEGDRDPDARTVRQFVTDYERTTRQAEILRSYSSKNYAQTFELGRTILVHDTENFFVLSVLSQAGFDNAQAGNATLNEATLGYAKRAIQLVESGKVIKLEPFKTIEAARGYLNAAVGTLLRDKSPAEAAQAFRKAVQSDSSYRTDPLTYHRLGVAILRGEFAQLSKEYNDKYLQQPPSAAQQAMLARINKLARQALDAYARAVALSDPARLGASNNSVVDSGPGRLTPELRNRILEQLTNLYKGLHNNSDAGLKELIARVLSTPLP